MKKLLLSILVMMLVVLVLNAKTISQYSSFASGNIADDDVILLEDVSADSVGEYHSVEIQALAAKILGDATIGGTSSGDIVTIDDTQTLTNKSLTSAVLSSADINAPDIDDGSIDGSTLGANTPCLSIAIDNILINGNTISSTDTDGNIILNPNGTGSINLTTDGGFVVITEGDLKIGATTMTATADELNLNDAGSNEAIYDSGTSITVRVVGVSQVIFQDGVIRPATDDDIDLGTGMYEFKDGFFDGTLNCDVLDCPGTSTLPTIDNDNITIAKTLSFDGTPENQTGAGEINNTTAVCQITTGAGAAALTIANGTVEGQLKCIYMVADGGGDATLTTSGSTYVFDDVNDGALLIWDNVNALWRNTGGATFTP